MKILEKYQITKIKFLNKLIHKIILRFNIAMPFIYWISNEKINYNDISSSFVKNILENRKSKYNFIEIELMKQPNTVSNVNNKINNLSEIIITDYLKHYENLFQLEKKRQDKLDSKIIQIITQSSLIITMISIIMTQVQDKIQYNTITYILLCSIGISIALIAVSIVISINETKPTGYLKPTPNFLGVKSIDIKKNNLTTYHQSIVVNTKVNDEKAKEINKAYSYYKYGLILFIITLVVLLVYSQYTIISIQPLIKNVEDFLIIC